MPAMLATGTTPTIAITSDQLQPIIDTLTSNLDVLLPVGITIMGIMIGVSLIPRIVYKFL